MKDILLNKTTHQWLIGAMFIVAGIGHFVIPEFYMQIMPPVIPFHLELVYLSGLFEILGGIGMFIPMLTRRAGYSLILLLLAVYPANIYMAVDPTVVPEVPTIGAVLRLPLQFVMIGWIYWSVRSTKTPIQTRGNNEESKIRA